FGSILLKKASLISTNHDSVFLKLSATGDGHDGSPDGRSEPAVLPFQPRRTDSSGSSPTPAQSNRHAGAGRSSREAGAILQRHRGRPSIDPELMIRMLIVGYCYGIRFERKLCEEVKLHLGYRWFCRLQLDDKIPDHSTFSVNRHGRFRDSDILRQVFEAVVRACMDAFCAPEDAPRFRAYAVAEPFRRARRIPPCRHRAELEDTGQLYLAAIAEHPSCMRRLSVSGVQPTAVGAFNSLTGIKCSIGRAW